MTVPCDLAYSTACRYMFQVLFDPGFDRSRYPPNEMLTTSSWCFAAYMNESRMVLS